MKCHYCKKEEGTFYWRGECVCKECYTKLWDRRKDVNKIKKCFICKKLITNKEDIDNNGLCRFCKRFLDK